MIFNATHVAQALGPKFPAQNIDANWPLIWASLDHQEIDSAACEIAAIATVAVETGNFAPIRERGGPGYFKKLYWDNQHLAAELGNKSADDAVRFPGRGFVQISGRGNYEYYGKVIHRDLVANPDDALLPVVAADILAVYFRDRRVHVAAQQGRWERVRRLVNGGLNGWADFISYVTRLQSLGIAAAPVLSEPVPGAASPAK